MRASFGAAAAMVLVCACSEESGPSVPAGFQPFVAGDWTMPAGREGYHCVRATATETMFIHAFRPIAPPGTHHTALGLDLKGGPDGSFPCQASDVGFKLLFGSGVGTDPYALPDGVAFKLEAGTQVLLNLHLYNTGDAPIGGESGIEVEQIAEADVVHEAETIYALDTNLSVPPGASVASGQCTVNGSTTIVGLFPHMHKLGNRMTATAQRVGAAPEVFFDRAYTFEEQLNYPTATPIELAKGDSVRYDCGYANPTGGTVQFGDSTDDEMCVLGMYRYPATGSISLCIN